MACYTCGMAHESAVAERPSQPETRLESMKAGETIEFLEKKGVERIDIAQLQPHQPFMYVLEDQFRETFRLLFDVDPQDCPSLFYLEDPEKLLESREIKTREGTRTIFDIANTGGKVRAYTIDPATKKPRLQFFNFPTKTFMVRPENCFVASEELFKTE
jgi:hypothetical protein